MALFGNKAVQSRIDEAVKILDRMTDGDFSAPIDTEGHDVVAPLMLALQKNRQTLERRQAENRGANDLGAEQTTRFEQAFDQLIAGIRRGQLSSRLDPEAFPPETLRATAERVNQLIELLTKPLETTRVYLEEIGQGNVPSKIAEAYEGDFNAVKNALNGAGETVTRLLTRQSALDNTSTGVMLVDNERKITYANQAVKQMLKSAEAGIREQLPGFSADRLIGVCIDSFHKKPAHQAELLDRLNSAHNARFKLGGRILQVIANPIIDASGERLGSVAEWLDLTNELALRDKEQQLAVENTRIRIALDNVTTNVMIADSEGRIIYLNKSIVDMLTRAEADIRQVLPQFKVSQLLGTNMDQFHRQPSRQQQLLTALSGTHHAQIKVGARTFVLNANPVTNEKNERLGSVVEWRDRTDEVAVEQEIADIVNAAGRGDFSQRIELANKQGFFRNLGDDMNRLMQTSSAGLNEVLRVLDAVAEGDLTETISNDYQGLLGQLKADSNTTVERLSQLVLDIKAVVNAVHTAARKIYTGNAELSQHTKEQTASLEQTASSMEQLASAVKHNADNAQQANRMALAASNVAVKGGKVVQQVVDTMSAINESSHKIVDIISVIDGIALQTNILALNAAVEAARAGEQGRGFAVVASEVRNLAQRSAAAAKEIKGLISDSVEKVEDGSQLVGEAGKTMEEIVNSVKQVTDIMALIAAASAKQTSGIEQVNTAIAQMDEATQQNAALVEQAAVAADSLEEQADRLTEAMRQFRLDPSIAPLSAAAPKTFGQKPARHLAHNQPGVPQKSDASGLSLAGSPSGAEWTEF
ncbi:methyl-accepting chemotaxis protein [Methylomicrobium sp. RS1]|uniref:methyl-accepting chemotaxis protein n=1 Tax=Candidatus Methylomicrobium oryzae TaxID=2802053 RepID=UPI00192205A1|nr:PAS domain-containing protein [Methylomicrobium sp. RS1]